MLQISPETIAVTYALCIVCKPIYEASFEFEQEKSPTISMLLPFLHQMDYLLGKESVEKIALKIEPFLEDELQEEDGEEIQEIIRSSVALVIETTKTLLLSLKDSYTERFQDVLEKATFLDPRFRGTNSISTDRQRELRAAIISELKVFEENVSAQPSQPKKPGKSSIRQSRR